MINTGHVAQVVGQCTVQDNYYSTVLENNMVNWSPPLTIETAVATVRAGIVRSHVRFFVGRSIGRVLIVLRSTIEESAVL